MVFSARMSSILGMLIGGGTILSWILTRNQASAQLANFVASVSTDPVIFMVVVAVFLLLIGMVMDVTATMITLIPLLTPVALSYGIEPLHFALVFVLTSMIGMITPPVGIVLFLVSSIGGVSVEALSKSIIPFVIWEFAVVIICIFFPSIVLWLPQMLGF
jgi:TRAP-type C4-dicarboxylate transport system permease large subunit